MRHHHHLPPTTQTVEVAQIDELNRLLSEPQTPALTAADLPLAPSISPSVAELPGSAVLRRLTWDGSPSFPNVYGRFVAGSTQRSVVVELHTAALLEISRRLHRHQLWGVGSPEVTGDLHPARPSADPDQRGTT